MDDFDSSVVQAFFNDNNNMNNCSNGLKVADALVEAIGMRHTGHTIEEVVAVADAYRANADKIAEHVVHFKQTQLSPAAAVEFAKLAIALRHNDNPEHIVAIEDVLAPRRSEDAGDSLWLVFNRLQESLIKGSYPVCRAAARPLGASHGPTDQSNRSVVNLERQPVAAG
jgi:hypothetical protein